MSRRLMPLSVLSCLILGFHPVALRAADPPGILNHQGRLSVGGVNHDGLGYFKFALVDGAGTSSYWSHDGTSNGGGEPAGAVEVTLKRGHYAVPLGDTSFHANMTNPIPAAIFIDHDSVHLRIWFSTAAGGPFEKLTPDQRVTSTGYALHATRAQGVADSAITEAMLSDGSVTRDKLAPGSVDPTILAPGAAGVNLSEAGSVGLGLVGGPPLATVHLNGRVGFPDPALLAKIVDETGGFSALAGAYSVAVSGTTAYVASYQDSSLTIIDVSNPAAPALLAEVVDGVGGFNALAGANCVVVSGTTAYVTSWDDNALTIIDVTNPESPTLLAEVVDGAGGFNALEFSSSVQVSGNTAYVTAGNDNALTIIDVTNPSAPALQAEVVDGSGGFNALAGPTSVDVSGNTAYVTAYDDNALSIIDISNPADPILLAEVIDGIGGFNAMRGVRSVQVSGTTAYLTSHLENSLTIIDVSNPAAPTLLAEVVDGSGGFEALRGAYSVHVSGNRAFVPSLFDRSLTIIDVSDPSAPRPLAEIANAAGGITPAAVEVSGTTGFVVSYLDHSLAMLDLGVTTPVDLATSNRVGIGTTQPAAMLHVEGDAYISGNLLDSKQRTGSVGEVLMSRGDGTQWSNLNINDADADPNNELQTLSRSGPNVILSDGGGSVSINDADASPTNELQALSLAGTTLSLSSGGGSVSINDADASATNELQALSLNGDSLSLSPGGGAVSLTRYLRSDASDVFSGSWLTVDGVLDVNSTLRVDSNAVYFHNATAYLGFDEILERFSFSDDLRVLGGFSTSDDLEVGSASGTDDDYIYFDAGAEHLLWNNFEGRFELSNNLRLDGNLLVEDEVIRGDTTSVGFGQPALQMRSHGTLLFMMDEDNSSNTTDQFEWYEDGGILPANKLMELQPDGDLRIRGTLSQSVAFDIAESFFTVDRLEPGDLVRVDPARPDGVRRSTGAAGETVLGVVSANPGFLLGGAGFDEGTLDAWGPDVRRLFREEEEILAAMVLAQDAELAANPSLHRQRVMEQFFILHFAKIALAGRIPVKVDTRFGAIVPGDRLAASPVPGVAMKASRSGPTLGVALEKLAEGEATVLTFIQSGWHEAAPSTETLVQELAAELQARDAVIRSLEHRLTALEHRSSMPVVTGQGH